MVNIMVSSLDLSKMSPPPGSRTKKVRLGRGESSGVGKTAGRGGKGQKGRSGAKIRRGFEGGQMPLYRRLPKLGFFSRKKTLGVNSFEVVSLTVLEKFENGAVVDVESLRANGITSKTARVKVLGTGALTKKLTVKVHAISASAKSKIEAAGGRVEVLLAPKAEEAKA